MNEDYGARSQIAELRRQLSELMRKTQAPTTGLGANVGTQYQQNQTWVRQVGFPAELTSTYDSSTGYSWKALTKSLAGATIVNAAPQATGQNAVEVGGDETLTSGTRVWLEPDPMGTGYEFTVGGSSPPSPPCCATDCIDLASLSSSACLNATIISVAGLCGGVTVDQEVLLQTLSDPDVWESGELTIETPEGLWQVKYDWPDGNCCPRLRFVSTGAGGTVTLRYLACVNGKYQFAGYGTTLCGEGSEEQICNDNSFIVEVECITCPTVTTTCCEEYGIPTKLYLTITGTPAALVGTYALSHFLSTIDGLHHWAASTDACVCTAWWDIYCGSDTWFIRLTGEDPAIGATSPDCLKTGTSVMGTCDPLLVEWPTISLSRDAGTTPCCTPESGFTCALGTFAATLSETPP